jgi:hypothetical protein
VSVEAQSVNVHGQTIIHYDVWRGFEVRMCFFVHLQNHRRVCKVCLDIQEVLFDWSIVQTATSHCNSISSFEEFIGDELSRSWPVAEEQKYWFRGHAAQIFKEVEKD